MSDRSTLFPGKRDAQSGFERLTDAFRVRAAVDGSSPHLTPPLGRKSLA